MERKLKPLSELAGDVRVNDVVQFYKVYSWTSGVLLENPEKSFVGYYGDYNEKANQFNFYSEPSRGDIFSVRIKKGSTEGGVYRPVQQEMRLDSFVSHYIILQRDKQKGNQ